MEIKHHPAADSFPMMDERRFKELVIDIDRNGQREPITICDGMILDGRNRYAACKQLGIDPVTRSFTGDPWAFVWSLNGERRDLNAEQRYLIWKICNEQSESFKAEQDRIQSEANLKRSEAALANVNAGKYVKKPETVVGQSVPPLDKEHATRKAKASASKSNMGAVARGDKLMQERPDLAQKVMSGEMKPAEAHRLMKREETMQKLESIDSQKAKELVGTFDVIVIDPPWPMQKIERDERPNQVEFDYPVMSEDELRQLTIPACPDCHVWLWTTHKFFKMALSLIDLWCLKYVCTFVWHKPGGFQPYGLPQYNCEFAIYAKRGSPLFIDTKSFNTCFSAPRGDHSQKPEEFYEMVRRVTAGRRLDMFSRRPIGGFEAWGKEAPQ